MKNTNSNTYIKNKKKYIIIFLIIYLILFSLPFINIMNTNNIKDETEKTMKTNLNSIKIKNKKNNTIKSNVNGNTLENNLTDKEKQQLDELSNIISTAKINIKTDDNIDNKIFDNIIKTDGYFNILNLKTGNIDRVSEKDYVIGAVCAEMPPTFHQEALKAQAVSAHTYALKMRQQQAQKPDPSLNGADFSADPSSWNKYVTREIAKKRFKDKFDEYWNIIESASNDVINIVMLYEDEPIIAAYHAISSGKTETASDIWGGDAPYLVATKSFGDNLAPGYETTATFSPQQIKNILYKNFPEIHLSNSPNEWFSNMKRSDSGSVLKINFEDCDISGTQLRNLLNLRSSNFIIDYDENNKIFNFIVKGYGHDIGLSQYGADYMAKNGSSFDEILKHYYSGISFAKTDIN